MDIIWHVTTGGCKVPTSHALNPDGYFRKSVGGRLRMMHVVSWEADRGRLCPQDREIHHLCSVRSCCNPRHLKAVAKGSHVARHNNQRAVRVRWAARKYWYRTGLNGTQLADVFQVSGGTGCHWIRIWKEEDKKYDITNG